MCDLSRFVALNVPEDRTFAAARTLLCGSSEADMHVRAFWMVIPALVACSDDERIPAEGDPAPLTCADGTDALAHAAVPDGYCASTFAVRLAEPRGLDIASNGDVLVLERGHQTITVLFDADGDGVSNAAERAPLAMMPGLNHAIRIHGDHLYASTASTVVRWPYQAGMRAMLGDPEIVVRGIPEGGRHVTRSIAFDADGGLLVQLGSATNVDPNATRARIVRFDVAQIPSGGVEFSSGELLADGLRNAVALDVDSQGRIWAADNGVDELVRDDLGGDIHEDNPSEEVHRIDTLGGFYGYPYCFSELSLAAGVGKGEGTQWAHPDFVGDGTHDDEWCRANSIPPIATLPAHTAPLGIVVYEGTAFDPAMHGDLFVALHGSWNRDTPAGYMVVRVPVLEDGTLGEEEPFLSFDGVGAVDPRWPHRPVGVRVGPDGALYVTSDASGTLIRVAREAI